jgi:ABC-2 type transport system permease protein
MIFQVVRTSWMNLRRDHAALMLSFVVPIVFFSIFASVFGGRSMRATKVRLAVADEDHSERSAQFVAALRAEGALRIIDADKAKKPFDARSAEAVVRAGDIAVALIIPKGFGASRLEFGRGTTSRPTFRLIADTSDPIAAQVAAGLVQKTVMTGLPEMMIGSGIESLDRFSGGLTPQQRATLQTNLDQFQAMRKRSTSRTTQPIVNIQIVDVLGDAKMRPMIAFYAAGIGVMFMLFTASNAGGALLEEHESGTLDRILSTRVSLATLLAGKLTYLCTLGILQLVVMFVWGALVFKLELWSHLAGFAIMALATAVACSTFGLLLASIARTRQQLGAITTLTVLSLSALGGSMFPRFLMPEVMQKAGLALFNAWAIEGFTRVFWRDEPLRSLLVPTLVLAGFAAIFFALAVRMTRRFEIA